MTRDLRSLLVHLGGALAVGVVLVLVCRLFGLLLAPAVVAGAALLVGAAVWFLREPPERDAQPDPPPLDLDADYQLPHGQDARVRRLEEMVHGAQPSRRMTARSLARVLGEIADERARDPEAPPLDPELRDLIERAREGEGSDASAPAIDRRALHRFFRRLTPTRK